MPSPRRATPSTSLVLARSIVLVVACAGCQRGCLQTWLGEHGGRPPPPSGGSVLEGIDCSDGLLRCVDGHVEASALAHVPYPCAPGPEGAKACICPWNVVAECRSGCAENGLEVEAREPLPDALCRPLVPVARPVLASDGVAPNVCAARGVRCKDDVVRGCDAAGAPERAIALCLHGCEARLSVDGEGEDGHPTNLDGRVSILCRHPDAERR